MIAGVWRCEIGKAPTAPIKVVAIDNQAANGGAMPANEFGSAMEDDICAPFQWPAEIWCGKGVVNHHRNILRLGNRRYFVKGEDCNIGVTQGFAIDNLGVGPDRLLKVAGILRVNKR